MFIALLRRRYSSACRACVHDQNLSKCVKPRKSALIRTRAVNVRWSVGGCQCAEVNAANIVRSSSVVQSPGGHYGFIPSVIIRQLTYEHRMSALTRRESALKIAYG